MELPDEVGATAHRVVQEGVTNALKHAAGAELHVLLAVRDGSLEVRVRDSGARAGRWLAALRAHLPMG